MHPVSKGGMSSSIVLCSQYCTTNLCPQALTAEQARSLEALSEEAEKLRRARDGLLADLGGANAREQTLQVKEKRESRQAAFTNFTSI